MGTEAHTPNRWPALALGAIVVGSFAIYTALSSLVEVPRVHPDEVRYAIAASSVVEGDGLALRGAEWEKIRCGKAHFDSLGVDFKHVTSATEV